MTDGEYLITESRYSNLPQQQQLHLIPRLEWLVVLPVGAFPAFPPQSSSSLRHPVCYLAMLAEKAAEMQSTARTTTIIHELVFFPPTSTTHTISTPLHPIFLGSLDALQAIEIHICFEGSVGQVIAMTDAEYLITDSRIQILGGIGPGSFYAQYSILPQHQLNSNRTWDKPGGPGNLRDRMAGAPAPPSSQDQSSEAYPYRNSPDVSMKQVHFDHKLFATARIPKRSTFVESPAGRSVPHSSQDQSSETYPCGNSPDIMRMKQVPLDLKYCDCQTSETVHDC
ncbi:hypothetical protein EV360DRAFT_89737 [Lentinula raphanica]|nr:hypothetical protein EV360DRAFT_89737 [Lentinula raphanica]